MVDVEKHNMYKSQRVRWRLSRKPRLSVHFYFLDSVLRVLRAVPVAKIRGGSIRGRKLFLISSPATMASHLGVPRDLGNATIAKTTP
jgi:hypothetical protein